MVLLVEGKEGARDVTRRGDFIRREKKCSESEPRMVLSLRGSARLMLCTEVAGMAAHKALQWAVSDGRRLAGCCQVCKK